MIIIICHMKESKKLMMILKLFFLESILLISCSHTTTKTNPHTLDIYGRYLDIGIKNMNNSGAARRKKNKRLDSNRTKIKNKKSIKRILIIKNRSELVWMLLSLFYFYFISFHFSFLIFFQFFIIHEKLINRYSMIFRSSREI